ncbi:TPA: hypothetical protein I8Y58_002302 [Legionella pneumophila]|uniref:Uncharacterized protein n=1 Tax=Legionella pneumophila TaxID=446 RepID=A0AAN5KSK8_LEGPN|nr:hypothetical protein [Legionella pneumophila]HAT1971300.1 hypothetical protein [Legionella pneumophila]
MHQFILLLFLCLINTFGFAKPCTFHRSCLELNNNTSMIAQINCNWLEGVSASGNSRGSTQLNLAYGDGLGAPEPRQVNCILSKGGSNYNFNFYNPYWGARIEFNLKSEKSLEVLVADGWSSQKIPYAFNW